MKKKILLTLILAIFTFNILGVNIVAIAADEETNSWDVSKNGDGSVIATFDEDGTLTITGNGDIQNTPKIPNDIKEKIKKVEIKQGVRSIKGKAFSGYYNLTEINISNTVTSIESYAFYECYRLKEINVASNNKHYMSENGVLFNKEKTIIVSYPSGKRQKEYTIPSTVKGIGDYAFCYCVRVTKVNIPKGLRNIGNYAFFWTNIKEMNIPNSVTSIGYGAFGECRNLIEINIPTRLMSIEKNTFKQCYNLSEINLPEGVTSIGKDAFAECYKLTEINIPSSVKYIGDGAFDKSRLILAFDDNTQLELPEIIKRTMNKDDNLYSDEEFTLTNCEMRENKKIIITDKSKDAYLKINGGILKGLYLELVPSGTIKYNDNNGIFYIKGPTSKDITATLHLSEGDRIINNDGKNQYTFTENGEFNFEYKTKNGEEKIATATVTNIDKVAPKIINIEKSENEKGEKILKLFLEDKEGGFDYVINDGKRVYKTESEVEYIIENKKRIEIYEMDYAGNELFRTIDVETCAIIGDVNEDGYIDFKDILEINKYRLDKLDKTKISESKLASADVNEDEQIDFKDMLQINKFRLGNIEFFEE